MPIETSHQIALRAYAGKTGIAVKGGKSCALQGGYHLQRGHYTVPEGCSPDWSERRFVLLTGEGASNVFTAKRLNVELFKAGIISSNIYWKQKPSCSS